MINLQLENLQPNFPNILNDPSGMLCFANTAKNEIKYAGRKLIGSAQRKLNSSLLQHGSILCGKFHRNIINFVNLEEDKINLLKEEIVNKTIDIETITGKPVDYDYLSKCLIDGFQETWDIEFEKLKSNTPALK